MNANCMCVVSGPISSTTGLKKSKAGKDYCSVNISARVFTGAKGNPYQSQLFSFVCFDVQAKHLSSVKQGECVAVCGTPIVGKKFSTNSGDEITPIELKNAQWSRVGREEKKESPTEDSVFDE